jgi:hypothetical protein
VQNENSIILIAAKPPALVILLIDLALTGHQASNGKSPQLPAGV